MLTDRELGAIKPREKTFKVTDRDDMYAAVLPTGTISFRYDYLSERKIMLQYWAAKREADRRELEQTLERIATRTA